MERLEPHPQLGLWSLTEKPGQENHGKSMIWMRGFLRCSQGARSELDNLPKDMKIASSSDALIALTTGAGTNDPQKRVASSPCFAANL